MKGMNEKTILVVDDEQNMRIALYETLSRNGYQVSVAENGRMALDMLQRNTPDLVITDIKMPEMDGIEMLQRIRRHNVDVPVLIMTGYATVATAVEAMKLGAMDYILKPFPIEVIEDAVGKIFREPAEGGIVLADRLRQTASIGERPIIGSDPKILAILDKAAKVASSKATILILGESGTGKEVLARYLHTCSDRRNGPFVALNCAALPEGLLESELFGHEKGAFTGAISTKKGKFELADNGTLLLDEIGEIPLHLQAKLLRVLQEEEIDRLGGKAPLKVNVHVLATTNRSLKEAVQEGTFRQDLYYRLNVIPLTLPPLRERRGDIPLLTEFFVDKYSALYGHEKKPLSPASKARFDHYDWPGNVREMENLIERAVLLSSSSCLEPVDFWDEPGEVPCNSPAADAGAMSGGEALQERLPADFAGASLKDVERQMILHALEKSDNNRTHAAKMLGVSVRTLRNKLQEYRSQGLLK